MGVLFKIGTGGCESWERRLLILCGQNHRGIGIWGRLHVGLPIIKPSLPAMAFWGLQVSVSLSDWISERHVFLTVLESGKPRSLAPADMMLGKAFLVQRLPSPPRPHMAEGAKGISVDSFKRAPVRSWGFCSHDLTTSQKPHLLIPACWALDFQHMNPEETHATYSNVSLPAKSRHPSRVTLSLLPLLHLACMMLSFVLFAPQLKCSTSLYDSESSLSKINVTSSLIGSAHSGLPILDSTPHSGVLLWCLILSDIVVSLILLFNSSIIDLISHFFPPQIKLKAINRRLHYLMFHMDCREV